MYQLHTKNFHDQLSLKKQADQVVDDLRDVVGMDPDIQIRVESEAKRKGLYSVVLEMNIPGSPLVVKKTGKKVFALLQKLKRTVLKSYDRRQKKSLARRRQRYTSGLAWRSA